MTTKFLQKTTNRNSQTHAIIKNRSGFSVVRQGAYVWTFVNGGKKPMSFESAQDLLAAHSL